MATLDSELLLGGVQKLLSELFDGPAPGAAWVLNPGDAGLLRIIDELDAEQASAHPIPGRSSLAGHVQHLRFSFELLNRWLEGEPNPYAGADWAGSWRPQQVAPLEWEELREGLRREAERATLGIRGARPSDEISLTGTLASAVHLAYHVGAVRQLLGLLRPGEGA